MCYFVEINLTRKALEDRFNVPMSEDPRYMRANFLSAFNQPFLPVIFSDSPDYIGMSCWGLIPSWTKNRKDADKIRNSTYNARSETVWEKPSFRASVTYRRCLILAHGFFEYQSRAKLKVPYYIKVKDNSPFAFAGLYSEWTDKATGEVFTTCSILTKKANPFMEEIHNTKKRMPVILNKADEMFWLNTSASREELDAIISDTRPELEAYTINKSLITGHSDPLNPDILSPFSYDQDSTLF